MHVCMYKYIHIVIRDYVLYSLLFYVIVSTVRVVFNDESLWYSARWLLLLSRVKCLHCVWHAGIQLLATASRDRLVHIFDIDHDYGLVQTLDDHSSAITAVRFTELDSQLMMLSCGADKSLLFRNAQLVWHTRCCLFYSLLHTSNSSSMVIITVKCSSRFCHSHHLIVLLFICQCKI